MKHSVNQYYDRRSFLRKTALGAGMLLAPSLALSPLAACASETDKKLGLALVGLGNYSTNKLGPALRETKYCRLTGVVTGDPAKGRQWAADFDFPETNIYSYETFNRIAENPDIDMVYVVLPNGLHAEFTIRAAQSGKHVICEKPMANTAEEARLMIEACQLAGVKLQIGYRCQYDPHHMEIMRLGQQQQLGKVMVIESGNSFYLGSASDNWRFVDPDLAGGGALMDMGVYCIQGARYTLGEEPLAVLAHGYNTRPEIFLHNLEETIAWQMEFPSGAIASCTASYGARADFLKVSAAEGNFQLDPCYQYNKPSGTAANQTIDYPASNQQAVQMDAFARNILDDTPVVASGEEGLRDMLVVEAIYRSWREGKRVLL